MIRILIADDHMLIREGFKRLIDSEIGLTLVGEVGNGLDALRFIRENELDLAVIDITMPGKNGLELIKEIRAVRPEVKILILTMHPEDRFAVRAMRAGADGYLTKLSAPTDFFKAIQKVMQGGKYVSEAVAEELAFELDPDRKKSGHEALSDREYEVFRLIGEGKNLTEIAKELSLSHSTINTYRSRILEKMNLRNNADIIHYVVRNNLLD